MKKIKKILKEKFFSSLHNSCQNNPLTVCRCGAMGGRGVQSMHALAAISGLSVFKNRTHEFEREK